MPLVVVADDIFSSILQSIEMQSSQATSLHDSYQISYEDIEAYQQQHVW